MRVTSIWAENFKSFGAKQTIPVSALTLLIGPNNAGKSNTLEILRTLRQFVTGTGIGGDLLRSGTTDGRVGLSCEKGSERADYWGEFGSRVRSPAIPAGLNERIASFDIWRLATRNFDAPSAVQRTVRLGPRGEQAAAVLDHLRDRYPKPYAALQADLRRCAPEIDRVVAEASENQPGNKELFFHQRNGVALRCALVSEGLKFLLFVLLLLHSPDPPRLFAIEEVDHGIHPRRIGDVLRFLRQLTETEHKPQILLTSHSPIVLDHFRDHPDEVVIVERGPDDATVCTALPKRLENLKGDTRETALGDLWYSGVLGGVPVP